MILTVALSVIVTAYTEVMEVIKTALCSKVIIGS